jgi:hypothetical protein
MAVSVNSRIITLLQLLLALLVFGCATHESVLSKALRPVLPSEEVDFPLTLFRARVSKGYLEVWGRVRRSDSDFRTGFDYEIESTAALCAALAKRDLIFQYDWKALALQLPNEYGSQWRWRNTLGYAKIIIGREILLKLRERDAPTSEYPQYGHLFAHKVGPPDYIPYEWLPVDRRTIPGPKGR